MVTTHPALLETRPKNALRIEFIWVIPNRGVCRSKVLALAVILCLLIPLQGACGQAIVKIVGIGAGSCAQFMEDDLLNPGIESNYVAWAQGYMSGLLLRAPAGKDENLDLIPSGVPLDKQAAFLKNFCRVHPERDFADAVNELYRTLRAPPG